MDTETIKKNIETVRNNIAEACRPRGRKPEDIALMAVTKTKPKELADAAYAAGVRIFGENRVQEAEEKYANFYSEGELHLIGHLQSNKAKNAAKLFSWVQSIDKVKTARALARYCGEIGKRMNILIEINTSGEESKFGYPSGNLPFQDIDEILQFDELILRGLMTVGPFTSDEFKIRSAFRTLKQLFDELSEGYPELTIDTLSMGMSQDYEFAVEEGSTMVRLGTTIFGGRGFSR
jgi:PLP dependent protein